jgi:protein deglycase
MPKKALIILAEGFEEIEAVTCIDLLKRAGTRIVTAGLNNIQVKGSCNITFLADKILEEKEKDFDACILPGGMPGSVNLYNSEKVRSLLKSMQEKNKIIAAICAAPAVVLYPLGITKDKSFTCYPGLEEKFEPGTKHTKEKVVADSNLITSQGPGTAFVFALKIIEILEGKQKSQQIKEATLST